MSDRIAESKSQRRVIGRLEPGVDLLQGLTEVCEQHRVQAGEIRATGELASVELSEIDGDSGRYVGGAATLGPLTLIQAYGNVSELGDTRIVSLRALVSGPDAAVSGGVVVAGSVLNLEFVIDAFDDIAIERHMDAETGLLAFERVASTGGRGPAPAAPAPPAPRQPPARRATAVAKSRVSAEPVPSAAASAVLSQSAIPTKRPTGWADVVAISEDLDEEDDGWQDGSDADIGRGDVLLHPRLGRLQVLRVEDDERAITRDKAGKPRTLSLSHLRVQDQGKGEDGRRHLVVEILISGKR